MTFKEQYAPKPVVWYSKEVSTVTENKYWIFLEKLRRSGVTNMYAAAPYLERQFGIPPKEADRIVGEWMEKYNPDDYKEMTSRGEEFLPRTAR